MDMTTRLRDALSPLTVTQEESLFEAFTAALDEKRLTGLMTVKWPHPAGPTAHAIVLREAYLTREAASAFIVTEVKALLSIGNRRERGTLAERAYAAALRRGGLDLGTYREVIGRGGGRLDRAVDLLVVETGSPRVGIEVKNLLFETLHHVPPRYLQLADLHRAMGAIYVLVGPAFTTRFKVRLAERGGRVIETGSYLVNSEETRRQLARLGVSRAIHVVGGERRGWTPDRNTETDAATMSIVPEVAAMVAQARSIEAEPLPRQNEIYRELFGPDTAMHQTSNPPGPLAGRARTKSHIESYLLAVERFRDRQCMACGRQLSATGSCIGDCALSGAVQAHEHPRQGPLALVVGMSEVGLRKMVRREGLAPAWKGRGRPRSENRNSAADTSYGGAGNRWEVFPVGRSECLGDADHVDPNPANG